MVENGIFPIISMSIFGLLTIRNIHHSVEHVRAAGGSVMKNRAQKKETQLHKMLINQIIVYIILTIPSPVYSIYRIYFLNVNALSGSDALMDTFLNNLFYDFIYLNYALTCLTFLFTSAIFRRELKRNTQSMELIFRNINKFQRLSSLKIINNNNNTIESAQLSLIYPQLNRLNISSEYYFSNLVSMTNLKHLILSTSCTYNQFQMLLAHCSKLVSLNFILDKDLQENISNIYLNLKRLIINVSSQVNMIQMKSLLNCFPSLDYFEIECRSDLDLCDGHQWESFISNNLPFLKVFNFKFQLKSTIVLNSLVMENIINSYSTEFWLHEKHWYTAIEWEQKLFYSVPRYSCESADSNFRCPYSTTSEDESIFSNHINALAVWGKSNHYFPNVKELWLVDNPSKINLESIIDVNKVHRLIFVTSKIDLSIDILVNLVSIMKNLNFIQFYSIPLSFVQTDRTISFPNIHSIEFMKEFQYHLTIEKLSQFFPNIERLKMKVKSNEDIYHVLNSFSNRLSLVTFHSEKSTLTVTEKSIENILGHSNFTCHIDTSDVRLWIGANKIAQFGFSHLESKKSKTPGCFSWIFSKKFFSCLQ